MRVCVFRFRKIDRKTENDRGKMSCVCVCVLFTERKRMKEKEIQVLKEERHCLGFFSTSGPGPKVPQKTPCPDAPPVSFGPPQPTDLQNNKFTHSTMDRPANQRELRVISLYLPGS